MSEFIRLCGVWKNKSGKGHSGSLGGARIFVFKNEDKKNENEPDLHICVAKQDRDSGGGSRDDRGGGGGNSGGSRGGGGGSRGNQYDDDEF